MPASAPTNTGYTYIELLIAVALGALLVAGLAGVVSTSLDAADQVTQRTELTRKASEAMATMRRVVAHSRRLLLPLADNPNTDWPENIREQTVPASPPIGTSTHATAVLAVTLPAYVDLDNDGVADADDDADGLFDEDLPNDIHHDFAPGIVGIDDDGDGSVDEGAGWSEDDEDGTQDEDPIDGIDNDGDGSVDEDAPSDNNGDGCPGICAADDDRDGIIDDGASGDDDEDGVLFDDPYDPVVFYLNNGSLIERMPVPWNQDGISAPDGPVDGRDFVESVLADRVTRFRVERIEQGKLRSQLVELTLELSEPASGETVSLQARIRIGGAL